MYPERDNGWCTAPRTSWEKLAAKADAGSRVRLRGITNMLGSGGSPALRGNARTWERAGAGERRRPARTQGQLVELGLDRKKSAMMLSVKGASEWKQVKGK